MTDQDTSTARSSTAPIRALTTGALVIDLRAEKASRFDSLAGVTRTRVRRALDGISAGDVVQLKVNCWSLTSDVVGLIPDGVRVQISADDYVATLREWQRALGAQS